MRFGFTFFVAALFLLFIAFTNIGHAETKSKKIIMLGDSLTAGYGLDEQESLPARLEQALRAQKINVSVINAGVSGDTTAGGLERLDWVLEEKADVLAIALGANDGLRGVKPQFAKENLEKIILAAKKKDPTMKILLIGMLSPPNMGKDYARQFNAMYRDLSDQYDIPLYPFMLEGVIANPSLNQNDGIHPTAAGIDVIVENILPFFEKNI